MTFLILKLSLWLLDIKITLKFFILRFLFLSFSFLARANFKNNYNRRSKLFSQMRITRYTFFHVLKCFLNQTEIYSHKSDYFRFKFTISKSTTKHINLSLKTFLIKKKNLFRLLFVCQFETFGRKKSAHKNLCQFNELIKMCLLTLKLSTNSPSDLQSIHILQSRLK